MSAVSGNCERCVKLGITKWCSGNRTDCENNLLNTIEALQQENKQLRVKINDWKYEVQCHMDEVIARDKEIEQLLEIIKGYLTLESVK